MQNIANQLPYAFVDAKKVTKSHIAVANVPLKIDIPTYIVINESETRQKCGRPVISKDKNPQKRNQANISMKDVDVLEEIQNLTYIVEISKKIK